MRTLLPFAALAASLIPSAPEVAAESSSRPLQTEEQRVLAAEDEYVAAEVRRDETTLRRLVDDRFVLNSAKGSTSDKEALVRSVLAMNMVGQTITERTVVVEGDSAVIFGTAELRFGSPGKDDGVSTLRYTSVYVQRDGQWRMLALQMAPRAPRQP